MDISKVSTTKMTTKGQVVIPEEIRDYMNLKPGVKFVVLTIGDSIMLKPIIMPDREYLRGLLEQSRAWAKENNFTEEDLAETIAEVRAENRKRLAKKLSKSSKRRG